jgi:acyl-CoA synthetase (AMP-forming)/AMP-acid ligase II
VTIRLLLDMAAEATPDRVAVVDGERALTFAGLAAQAAHGSSLITASGHHSLAYVGTYSTAVPALLFAAAGAGVPFAPLNYRLSADRLAALVARLDVPLVVAEKRYADALSANGRPVLTTAEWFARAAEPRHDLAPAGSDDQAAVLLFTSGTTAAPKCAVLRHSHLLSYALGTVEFGHAAETECALVSVPPYHVAGIGAALTNLYSGRRIACLPDFTAAGWLDLVRRERVTHAMVVPTMLARIVEHLDGADANCPSLVSLAYGGARMPTPILRRALAAFSGAGFVNAYGLTETSSTIAVLGPDDHRAALSGTGPDRLASVGRLVPGIEAQIRGPNGSPLPSGVEGELWVRGSQVSGEYDGLGSVIDNDGWFPTRDRAVLDPEGYLYLAGRADDTIIRGGENISPAEIEDVLLLHPEVREATVIGIPDDHWGERLAAVVVPVPGHRPNADELRRYVRGRLRGSRTPDEVIFRTELPYTATGKVLRRQLISELTAAGARDKDA